MYQQNGKALQNKINTKNNQILSIKNGLKNKNTK